MQKENRPARVPARPVRDLRESEADNIRAIAARYVELKNRYLQEEWS